MSTVRLCLSVPPTRAFPASDACGAALLEGPATADAASSPAPTSSIATESVSRLCTETPFAGLRAGQSPSGSERLFRHSDGSNGSKCGLLDRNHRPELPVQ